MTSLSPEDFQHARSALLTHGRALDIALFRYHFEGGSRGDVVSELLGYQHNDGGFGRALEPDFRLDDPSPMATSVGLQYADHLDLDADHPLVRAALEYLQKTYQRESGYWPATFTDVNDAPHAPWWHREQVIPPTEAEWPNPNAELLGYLWKFKDAVPDELLGTVTDRAEQNLDGVKLVGNDVNRRYAILCWERALPHFPTGLHRRVRESLKVTLQTTDLEATLKELYPFAFAFSPETTVATIFPDWVDRLLETDIERQSVDGGWWPTWSWGQYEDTWAVAEHEWVGKLTLECLLTLDRFDKIET